MRQTRYQVRKHRIGHARIHNVRDSAQWKRNVRRRRAHNILLELVLCEHENLRVPSKALYRSEISRALLLELGARHDLEHVEAGPRHVVTKHFQIREFHERSGFEVHVVGPYFFATFFYALGDVLFLRALVVAQASNEVVEGFFEPKHKSVSM